MEKSSNQDPNTLLGLLHPVSGWCLPSAPQDAVRGDFHAIHHPGLGFWARRPCWLPCFLRSLESASLPIT